MNDCYWKRYVIIFLGLFLFMIVESSYAGLGYYVEERHWGYQKGDYGEPKPGYGYLAPLIKQVQSALKDRGYDPGLVDGSWGKKTEEWGSHLNY